MPISIQKPALRDLTQKLMADPNARVDGGMLDQIVAIVGDKSGFAGMFGITTAKLAQRLQTAGLTAEDKLQMARNGLDAGEKRDLLAMLGDADFTARLDASGLNFLKAVVGLEPLKHIDRMQAAPAVIADPSSPQVQAAAKLRELIKSNQLKGYYDAAIDAVDNPALKAEALALFAALPTIKPGMGPDDFVKAGVWKMAPRGVAEMQKSARYLPGRQVQVETTVFAKLPPGWKPPSWNNDPFEAVNRKIGTFDPSGPVAVTHRATLVGEDPTNKANFLVNVDGADKPISVTKESIYLHNHPHEVSATHIKSDTKREIPWGGLWEIDYASPLAKAKLCEIALKMEDAVAQLDFAKTKTEGTDGMLAVFGRGAAAKTMVELQKSCVDTLFRSIDMQYPRDNGQPFTDPGRAPQGTRDVARQAIRGTGMCVQQSCVFGALLTPFMDVLGVDGQYRSGNCFRNIKTAVDNVFAPDYSTGHGWWQITFRPSMEMTVTDRTWDQVNLAMDRAYGFPGGDRNARSDIYGYDAKKHLPTDVNMSGTVTVETFERQFARAGDGRENHISRHNGP